MNLTKSQCEEFRKNPSVNPLTGRTIQVGNVTHKKLAKACEGKGKSPNTPIPDRPAPPMGPMIHWRYDVKGHDDEFNNMVDFGNFIKKRINTLGEENGQLSFMELEDLNNIIEHSKKHFDDEPKYIQRLDKMKSKVQELMKKPTVLHDQPNATIVAHLEIKPSRTFIRGNVLRCYQLWKLSISTMRGALKNKSIYAHEPKEHIANLVEQKAYLDYLIKHKIFSREDIYDRTFKTDKPYEELKETFAEYSKLYKQVKGKSP